MNVSVSIITALLGLASLCACTKQNQPLPKEPEGYRVMSSDLATGQYVIIRTGTFDKKYLRKQLTVVCSFYQWGNHEMIKGPHACDLRVGQFITSKHDPDPQGGYSDYVDVWELSPEVLSIQFGDGSNKILQQFFILRNQMLPD